MAHIRLRSNIRPGFNRHSSPDARYLASQRHCQNRNDRHTKKSRRTHRQCDGATERPLLSTGDQSQPPPPANEHIGSLKTTPIPNTNLLEVTVKGRNASEVKQLIEAVIHHLRLTHDKIAEPAITLQQKRLDALTNTISQSRQQLKALRSSPSLPTPVTDSAVLYHFLINQQDTELAQLEGEKNTLELSLSPTSTYSTALFSQIKVENKAQTPNRLLLILTGSFVGCIVGLFISVALTRLQRSQGKPISSDIHM